MFWNPGVLPEGWTVETLTQKHSSQPYNPDIANVFFRSGMIEAWGRGVEKVFDSCRKSGIKEPYLRYEQTGLWVEFVFTTQKTIQKTTQKTIQKTIQKQQKILSILKKNPGASQQEIAKILGNISSNGVKYHLRKMRDSGLIRRVGPDKGGLWEIIGNLDKFLRIK